MNINRSICLAAKPTLLLASVPVMCCEVTTVSCCWIGVLLVLLAKKPVNPKVSVLRNFNRDKLISVLIMIVELYYFHSQYRTYTWHIYESLTIINLAVVSVSLQVF